MAITQQSTYLREMTRVSARQETVAVTADCRRQESDDDEIGGGGGEDGLVATMIVAAADDGIRSPSS